MRFVEGGNFFDFLGWFFKIGFLGVLMELHHGSLQGFVDLSSLRIRVELMGLLPFVVGLPFGSARGFLGGLFAQAIPDLFEFIFFREERMIFLFADLESVACLAAI